MPNELFSIKQEKHHYSRGMFLYSGCESKCALFERLHSRFVLILGRTRKFIPHRGTQVARDLPKRFA